MATCDKCKANVDTGGGWNNVACFDCDKVYVRCGDCGALAGARRSLHSHRALHHPSQESQEADARAERCMESRHEARLERAQDLERGWGGR